jgi:hypothetical protein
VRTITPQPGYAQIDTTNALKSGQFIYVDNYTITPLVGTPLRYTSYQQEVNLVPVGDIGRRKYVAGEVLVSGLLAVSKIGTEVDEQQMTLDYGNSLQYQNRLPWSQAILQGQLDGAMVKRDRYIAAAHNTPWLGGFTIFEGRVSSIDMVGRQSATVKVKSELVLLNVNSPRELYDPNCRNTWGDANCGVIQSAYAVIGAVDAHPPSPLSTRTTLYWNASNTNFSLGKLYIDNGDGVTRIRTILNATSSALYLSAPLDFDPVSGMTFTAYPGCNRTMTRCQDFHGGTWANFFKGFPFVPVVETAY